jgi:hypothetical protein
MLQQEQELMQMASHALNSQHQMISKQCLAVLYIPSKIVLTQDTDPPKVEAIQQTPPPAAATPASTPSNATHYMFKFNLFIVL